MDCPEVEAAILRGAPPTEPGLESHLGECPSCRFLVEGGGPIAQALAGSAAVPAALELPVFPEATLARERGPLAWARERSRPARVVAVALVMALAIAVYVHTAHLRADWGVYPALRLGLTLGGFAILALLLTWQALRPIYLPPAATGWLLAAGIAAPIVAGLLPELPTAVHLTRTFQYYAIKCFLLGGAQALAVFAVARAVARGRTGAIVAAAGAGLAGVLGLVLHCPINAPAHLLAGHATVPVVLALFAYTSQALAISRSSR
jgi:hypothetical protein